VDHHRYIYSNNSVCNDNTDRNRNFD
jgi:hypothetical protein